MRYAMAVVVFLSLAGCGGSSAPGPAAEVKPKPEPVKITQFYASDPKLPRGVKGTLCYGVEHAEKVALSPPADAVWPSPVRCIEISPKQSTTYTLTAYGADGSKTTKTAEVVVGAPPPRLYDLSVNSTLVNAGDRVIVCFKVENAKSVKAGPGHFDTGANCITDEPMKTTVYKISALGGDNQVDSGTVTVKVR